MVLRVANCPNCGGQVEFKAGTSILSVCPYCSSVVARTGGDVGALEVLGKVAPLAAIGSPLALGTSGRYRGKAFTLIGRLQLDYGAGPWNEWYAAFDSGSWGWLAEAQGRVYFTFRKAPDALPTYAEAPVGARVRVGAEALTVVERRRARFVSAEGELPSAVVPGRWYRYADLEGEAGAFGTIDYGEGETAEDVYLGEQVAYADVFDASVLRDVAPARAAGAVGLNCPNCGAAVELRAPDESMRVTCSACDALLDCETAGNLKLLSAAKRQGPEPRIPLGARGKILGVEYIVFGHLLRSVVIAGTTYSWEEYLLRGKPGWRWLVVSDGHWSFVEPVSAGDVSRERTGVRYKGTSFQHFQSAEARVDAIRGEFYWKVAVGETVRTADFVAPPRALSMEASEEEVTWSLGRYLGALEVRAAFGLPQALPAPRGVGAFQPNPHASKLRASARTGAILTLALLLVAVLTAASAQGDVLFDATLSLASGEPVARDLVSDTFQVKSRGNLEIGVQTLGGPGSLYLQSALIDQSTKERHRFGVRAGPAFHAVYVGSIPPGTYALAFAPQSEGTGAGSPGRSLRVRVRHDVFLPSHVVLALILIWAPAALVLGRKLAFEKARWAESDHA